MTTTGVRSPSGIPAMAAWMAATVWTLSLAGARGQSSTPRENTWVTNGPVYAIARTPTTVYIGGEFTVVGPYTGGGTPVSATTGQAATFSKVNGTVLACAPDGSGGWYVGGTFTQVGRLARNNLAHILPDGGVDAAFDPNADSDVKGLALSGSTLYVGGQFTRIGGQTRNCIAALDAMTGFATPWNPNADDIVYAVATVGSTVYAAGEFTRIGGQARNCIAALDAATALATPWDPDADSRVYTVAAAGSTVYAGGQFRTIGGQTRARLAALDAATGLATAWDPEPQGGMAPPSIRALAISGATVYAAGRFGFIAGQTRNNLAALDAETGLATDWDPNAIYEGIHHSGVYALALSGSMVYAGGEFTSIGGQPRRNLAALDAATGLATNWAPTAASTVRALGVSGSTIYVGGSFTSIGGQVRNNIAALDAATGLAKDWNPDASGSVRALAASDSTIYAGGNFSRIGGQTRNDVAALDAATGLATDWDPNPDLFEATKVALDLWGSTVYAGGDFEHIGGQERYCIAALDATTGLATDWDPNATDGLVVSVLERSGSTVYAGGLFTNMGGQVRNGIAALDAATGLATAWDPNAGGSYPSVFALALSGSTVYAGGAFISIGGQARSNIAALDAATGLATDWDPNANDPVRALAVLGSTVYAGGSFTAIGGQARPYFAQFDTPAPEIEVKWPDNGQVIADGDTTPSLTDGTDFGGVLVNGGTAVRTFSIANVGTLDLALTGSPKVALSGPNASDFSITQTPSSPVAPSGATTFGATFDPQPGAAQTRQATLSIANNDADEAPYDFAIQGTLGDPRLRDVADGGAGSAILSWEDRTPKPSFYLGFAWDIYGGDWAKTNPADPATMWFPFPTEATSGTMQLGWTGAYHVWISNFYSDASWLACDNPWTGILYDGAPHTPLDVSVEDLGGGSVRLHWKPEIFGTWHYQIIAFRITSLDPFAGEWLAVDGPGGTALWHYIDYGGFAYDPAKANYFEGWADFSLRPGSYWLFLRGAGWTPPFPVGEYATGDAAVFEERMFILPGDAPLRMLGVAAGIFAMGSPPDERSRNSDEGPLHTVTIGSPFFLGQREVTQRQWQAVMGTNPVQYWGVDQGWGTCGLADDYPVYYVSWDDCSQFISALNGLGLGGAFRLPSEAEGEYACRAGTTTRFFFGDSLTDASGAPIDDRDDDGPTGAAGSLPGNRSDYMWFFFNAETPAHGTKPVGTKRPNQWGLFDASGNVLEWRQDRYHTSYAGAPADGSAWNDPQAGYPFRVCRGGGWVSYALACRSAYRAADSPDLRSNNLGLRLAWTEY